MSCLARPTFARFLPLLMAALLAAPFSSAQQAQRIDLAKLFDKREVMIPVRDGVKLHTEIYAPKRPRPFVQWSRWSTLCEWRLRNVPGPGSTFVPKVSLIPRRP